MCHVWKVYIYVEFNFSIKENFSIMENFSITNATTLLLLQHFTIESLIFSKNCYM